MDEACECMQQKMIPCLQGQLSSGEIAELMSHLSTCPGCRQEMAEWIRLERQLSALVMEVPEDIAATAFARIPLGETDEAERILSNPLSPFMVVDLLRYLLSPVRDTVQLAIKCL